MKDNFLLKTFDDLKFYDSKINAAFSEMMNSSENTKKYNTRTINIENSKYNESPKINSTLLKFKRKMSAKIRPSSVISRFVDKYTPISKHKATSIESKQKKKIMKKLKSITKVDFKEKSSSMKNNRRPKKSGSRIERTKFMQSKS